MFFDAGVIIIFPVIPNPMEGLPPPQFCPPPVIEGQFEPLIDVDIPEGPIPGIGADILVIDVAGFALIGAAMKLPFGTAIGAPEATLLPAIDHPADAPFVDGLGPIKLVPVRLFPFPAIALGKGLPFAVTFPVIFI